MYLFYIDESGNTGADLANTVEPIHWLVAIGMDEHCAQRSEQEIMSIADRYFGGRAREADFEIHGSELFNGRGEARALTPAERVALYDEILAVVPRCGGKVWIHGINKPLLAERARQKGYTPDHPYKLCFMYLVEAIDRWLAERQPQPSLLDDAMPGPLGLLVSDEQDEMERTLVSGLARWRQWGTDHGYRARHVKYLVDTVHYVKSQDSWLIQLADCVSYIRNRHQKALVKHAYVTSAFNTSEQAVERLWRTHCLPAVIHQRTWP